MDAVASRDAAYEYLAVATCCALNLSRLAEEIVLWSSQEFGFLRLPDAWSSGSSIMPQKRNPDAAELIRGKAAGFVGRLTSLGTLLKGLPLAYNTDLREDKRHLFDAVDCLDELLPAVRGLLAALEFVPQRMAAACDCWLMATDVADYLVGKGLPFREAHAVAGRLVALAAAGERPLEAISPDELSSLSPLFDDEYYDVVNLRRVVAAKVSYGGTAPASVERQLVEAATLIGQLRTQVIQLD